MFTQIYLNLQRLHHYFLTYFVRVRISSVSIDPVFRGALSCDKQSLTQSPHTISLPPYLETGRLVFRSCIGPAFPGALSCGKELLCCDQSLLIQSPFPLV